MTHWETIELGLKKAGFYGFNILVVLSHDNIVTRIKMVNWSPEILEEHVPIDDQSCLK